MHPSRCVGFIQLFLVIILLGIVVERSLYVYHLEASVKRHVVRFEVYQEITNKLVEINKTGKLPDYLIKDNDLLKGTKDDGTNNGTKSSRSCGTGEICTD